MAEEDDAQKTEDPSAKKLSDAKAKGQVAQSQEIKSWAILLGGAMGIIFLLPWMSKSVVITSFKFIEQPHSFPVDFENLRLVFVDVILDLGVILAPIFAVLIILALVSSIAQVGLNIAGEKVKPDISKISLIGGIKKKFSAATLVEFLKGILKLTIVGVIAFALAIPFIDDLELIPFMALISTIDRIHLIALVMTSATVMVMTVISAVDYVFQRHTFMKQMMMSKQEVKDEHKNAEGDPQVKGRIRQIRMDRARQRMMAAVPEADVVVTNPTHYSVALKYDMEQMPAPLLVAKGVDDLAFRIREVAEEHDIPLVENAPLARALYANVDLDEEIPAEHFAAVAEVIGFVMRQRGDLQ